MITGRFQLWRIAALVLAGTGLLAAGNFVAPAEGPVPFRRDRLPIDADTMIALSRQLVVLTRSIDATTPVNRQTAARSLALAMALEPGSSEARDLLTAFEKGWHRPQVDGDRISKAQNRLWNVSGWLESPTAGPDGQALAACLNDVMAVFDARHPKAEAIRNSGDRGGWTTWVGGLKSFEESKAGPPVAEGRPDPTPATPNKPRVLLAKAKVRTTLWLHPTQAETDRWVLKDGTLTMAATEAPFVKGEERTPFALVLGTPGESAPLASMVPPLVRGLASIHGTLPQNCQILIDGPDLNTSLASRKRHPISAAVAVLASSALSGREPDATIVGVVDETGAFKLPTSGFWEQLRALMDNHGKGRLVIPAAAADYLPSVLAFEHPEFFMNYEVILASNIRELIDASAKTPPEAIAKASAQFAEIQSKVGTTQTNAYVANPFVRRRLAELATSAPSHASAKLLAIQGAGNRPTVVRRDVLAVELRRVIEPVDAIVKHNSEMVFNAAEIDQMSTTYEELRDKVTALNRYADSGDRALVTKVQEMVALIRPLERAARGRGDVYSAATNLSVAFAALVKGYQAVQLDLGEAAGEPKPQPGQ